MESIKVIKVEDHAKETHWSPQMIKKLQNLVPEIKLVAALVAAGGKDLCNGGTVPKDRKQSRHIKE